MSTEKPLAEVYKWVGFVAFWGALLWGLAEALMWVVKAHYFISAMYPN